MLRKTALRFLVLIAMSWLFPHTAGALDFSNGFPVGNWGNGIRPHVRVSAQDGRLSAIARGGFFTRGEPISSSAMTTVQLAVPPRISGPYEGIQVTSLPVSIAA